MYFETTGSIPLFVDHVPRVFTSPVSALSDMTFITQIFTDIFCICHYSIKLLKKNKTKNKKAPIIFALNSFPSCRIRLPISICLDLSVSFSMFGSLTAYVLVLMLLMKGYAMKCTYSIPKIFHIYSTKVILYFQLYTCCSGLQSSKSY